MTIYHDNNNRGKTRMGWLDSSHTFSFGHFQDPNRMGFRALRVVNEDHVIPGAGFGEHGHQDMEILTFVISGALRHGDSLGNGSVIKPGEIQRMYAGAGIRHSEMNAANDNDVHFLQIWIEPDQQGGQPEYEQVAMPDTRNEWVKLAAPKGQGGLTGLYQDATLSYAMLDEGHSLTHERREGRGVFVQMVSGMADVNGQLMKAGDGLQTDDLDQITITAGSDAQILLFDLA